MVRDKYAVRLAQEQREDLQRLVRVGKNSARVTARARILLKSGDGWAAPQVAEALDVALSSIPGQAALCRRRVGEGFAGPSPGQPAPEVGEAHLIALACSPAPEGHDHWTLRLLAGKVVELGLASSNGNPKASQKNTLKPWQKKEWCIPKVSAEFVANMEACPGPVRGDPQRPVVCFDEQLLAETRPAPGLRATAAAGEYRREGRRNLFLAEQARGGDRAAHDEAPIRCGGDRW